MGEASSSSGPPTGLNKAAILMVLLGEEPAGAIYRNLPEEDLRLITEQIAKLKYVSPDVALAVLEEFQRLSMTQDYLAQGGSEYAHKLLVAAFGEEGAQRLIEQVTASKDAASGRLEALGKIDAQQLAKFLEAERTGTVVMGKDVRLNAVSILHGSLSIEIATQFAVSQPEGFSKGQTTVVPQQEVRADEKPARRVELAEGATVEQLVSGLQAIGATSRDVIAILQAIKRAGALEADLEVI
jgi:hypothetical protein